MNDDIDENAAQRRAMVASQIAARGLTDACLLAAFEAVPRHLFVPIAARAEAYRDEPLPIGFGQTISQPYIVALMTSLVRAPLLAGQTVLEVGAGSGYQTAILAALGCRVVALEVLAPLADRARVTLATLGFKAVEVLCRDGRQGAADHMPAGGYAGIVVAAASADVPPTLLAQLAIGARLVIPLATGAGRQELVVFERTATGVLRESVLPVRFVPLV